MEMDKIEAPVFRATVNDLNQITVPAYIRQLYGIETKREIVLEFKGMISKTEKFEPAFEMQKDEVIKDE